MIQVTWFWGLQVNKIYYLYIIWGLKMMVMYA